MTRLAVIVGIVMVVCGLSIALVSASVDGSPWLGALAGALIGPGGVIALASGALR